jgi:nucleoside-diphosphate-sugar epimerase
MTNQSLFQLIETIRRRRFVFIGKKGASANYIAVDNVVDAMISCGTAQQSSGRVYNISDYLPIETFIAAIADALGVQRPRIRLPELPLRMVARALGGMRHMPLTESRVNALVNRCIYSNERIEKELGYAHRVSMEDCLLSMVKTVRGTG